MEERRNRMAELIRRNGNVSFAQLKELFPEISEMTLRRDLESLDQARRIVRVHGGARSVDAVVGTDGLFTNRSVLNVERKKLIARKAAGLLQPNTALFLDSGTTLTEFARVLPDEHYLIVTSGLTCALELARLSRAMVHVLGGRLNNNSLSVNGQQSVARIEEIHFDMAFFGVTGYSAEHGFTTGVLEEYELKSAVRRKARKVVLLMDSTKVGLESTFTFARVGEVHVVVSDDRLDPAVVTEYRANGIEVI
jgi:DeoR family transcriptional regulator, aga operon transcriptional repressor